MNAIQLERQLLAPARKVLTPILRLVPGDPASNPEVRAQVLALADLALTQQFPAARLIPASLRQRILGNVLDSLLPARAQSVAETAAIEAAPPIDLDPALELAAPAQSVQGLLVDAERDDGAAVARAAVAALGAQWKVEKVEGTRRSFHLTNDSEVLSVREGWELAHRLTDQPFIATAEPVIEWVVPGRVQTVVPETMAAESLGAPQSRPDDDPDWSFVQINAQGAWDAARDNNRPEQGDGIVIAHLDTGITHHAELPALDSPSLRLIKGANFYDPGRTDGMPLDSMDAGAVDFLRTWFIPLNGHGTGTLSCLVSPRGRKAPASGNAGSKYANGTAPKAIVAPLRIGPTVVHWNLKRMIDGIRFAHEVVKCDVITMSMGGPPPAGSALHDVIEAAVDDGVIFCAAAGNVIGSNDITPIVVWPAALDEVVAIGGSNFDKKAWNGSSRGPEVNISAPAEYVWHASGLKGALKPSDTPGTDSFPGNGTSFATPATAGLAACWLAFHGRQELIAHYGHPKYIPRAFASIVRNVAFNTPPGWNKKNLGPGIIDGGKLLRAALPDKAALDRWPTKKHSLSSFLIGLLLRPLNQESVAESMMSAQPQAGAAPLEPDDDTAALVRRYGAELQYHLFDHPELAEALLAGAPAPNSATAESALSNVAVAAPKAALATMRALVSPTLAREFALSSDFGGALIPQARRNLRDDSPAAAELAPADAPENAVAPTAEAAAAAEAVRPWRVAKSLLKLRDQVNAFAPRRRKGSDGTIGDERHRTRDSDHNPWVTDGSMGVVTALDITHDPSRGCDVNSIVEAIRGSRDSRVKYIIWNRRIANHQKIGNAAAWQWRAYGGENPHTAHCHISVVSDKAEYDSTRDWKIQ
jgi:hypothetical protein